jgi:CRISPR system Cascade subunit CasA
VPEPEPLNLVTGAWLPVRRRSGAVARITPSALTDGIDDDPIVAFAWSRPDFDAAARELVIGLLATACGDRLDRRAWPGWWERPPAPDELAQRLAPLAPFFTLDGEGPRFMQDLDPLADGSESEVAALLIDSPGGQTLEQNRDLFVKRRRVTVLGRAAAAMALFTLNAFAPAGGAGIRTSLRGGGPFTCLVAPGATDGASALWRSLWLNVEAPREAGERPDQRFPWCVPTRVSKQPGTETSAADVDPLQAFWGMPRRTRLLFEPNPDRLPCDLTGAVEPVVVRRYRSRPHGNNYKGWSRAHPLTPYYRAKAGDREWLARHPQPGRLAYKDWVGLVVADGDGPTALAAPAAVVDLARRRLRDVRAGDRSAARLVAAGYDMDKMKPRGFVESVMPVVALAEEETQAATALARRLVAGADAAVRLLTGCVRQALVAEAGDRGEVQQARDRFWAETEPRFFALLADAAATATREDGLVGSCRVWRRELARRARAIFDGACPLDPEAPRGIEAVIAAHRRLGLGVEGHGKEGRGLFAALGLAPPAPGDRVAKERKRAA